MASSSGSWERAWNDAQPRLQEIRNTLPSFASANPRVTRVGKLDSELLDQELVSMLKEPLVKAFALIKPIYRTLYEPELTLLIQATLYKLAVWDSGATCGARLQGLKYEARNSGPSHSLTPSGLPRKLLLAHAALTVITPYAHTRLRAYAQTHSWADAPSSDARRKAWELLVSLETAHATIGLFSFIAFLWDGRYRSTADRLLGLRLVPSQRMTNRQVSYEFMNRQMVWHAFTEFILFLLPLVNMRALRRRFTRAYTRFKWASVIPATLYSTIYPSASASTEEASQNQHKGKALLARGKYFSLPEDDCAICAKNAELKGLRPTSSNASPPAASSSYFGSTISYSQSQSQSQSSTDARMGSTIRGPLLGSDPERIPTYPINIPYVTSCDHIYCYACLTERMLRAINEEEEGWECLRCTELVRGSARLRDLSNEQEESEVIDDTTSLSELESGYSGMMTSLNSDDFPSTNSVASSN